ncbi:protein prenyltransferase alpha subunit repeat-containing protein 1-like isoform X2 [Quercus lobata]|uniref:protein prenyltransferase alpha subunit repeat-containing protein 1-like isoform X2 n=1 Tax=Quercus lobata TaxID=97700 RepID=UPI001244CB48|nr:protein prenyltransferase alpha subunit repeat-containing protein 1-like isoform X2 [Quercus lobata]
MDLLLQFQHILESDPLIDEVGFVHPTQFATLTEDSTGDAAISDGTTFWCRDHKLGVSTQAVLPLYNAAKRAFIAAMEEYKRLGDDGLESEVMKHSKALLLLSSDFGTAWNSRKLVVSKKQQLSMYMGELLLSALVLSCSPKSDQAWSHRRWVIKSITGKCSALQEILGKESELVEKIAERSKMNYRAWNHRCWLVSYMTREQVLHELKKSRNWAGLHVADNCCFHYRRRLMLWILKDSTCKLENASPVYSVEVSEVWKEELDWNEMLIKRYIGREALWLHRRFLSLCWMKQFATNLHDVSCHSDLKISTSDSFNSFIDNELHLLNSCSTLPDNDFEDFQVQATYSATYTLWLTKQIPEFWFEFQEKLTIGNLKTMLSKVCPERSFLWDSLID